MSRPANLTRYGRWAATSMLASANAATRAFHLGLGAGARAAARVAQAAEGVVPGGSVARQAAESVESSSTAAAAEAARRTADSLALFRRHEPAQPTESEDGSNGSRRRTPGWLELAADTAAAPISSLAALGSSVGSDVFQAAVATPLGSRLLDQLLRRLRQGDDQREALIVVANESGVAVARSSLAFAEAALRLPFGDTRHLHRALEDGLQELRTLASAGEMHELLPVPVIDARLRDQARLTVDSTPRQLLAALEASPSATWSSPAAIFRAALADADQLRVFAFAYPQTAWLMAANLGKQVVAGSISFQEMEAFLEGRRLAGQGREAGPAV